MHLPVMVHEVLELLDVKMDKWYVDCTIGGGGHSEAILSKGGRVFGIDQDSEVLELAKKHLEKWKDRVIFKHGNFRNIKGILEKGGLYNVSGFLYDLGFSSYQIEDKERGFSFMKEGPLDMRMDKSLKIDAAFIVNKTSEKDLTRIIKEYGEEPKARSIAKMIVSNRPIKTTTQLSSLIQKVYYGKRGKIHPSTRTFQALRIAVNDELNSLKESLDSILPFLEKGGRVVVLSFHSLEDRIVKEKFKTWAKEGIFDILTKKPIRPTSSEIEKNPRARSAKLRGGMKR